MLNEEKLTIEMEIHKSRMSAEAESLHQKALLEMETLKEDVEARDRVVEAMSVEVKEHKQENKDHIIEMNTCLDRLTLAHQSKEGLQNQITELQNKNKLQEGTITNMQAKLDGKCKESITLLEQLQMLRLNAIVGLRCTDSCVGREQTEQQQKTILDTQQEVKALQSDMHEANGDQHKQRSMLLMEITLLENEKQEQISAMIRASAKADLQLQRQLNMLQDTQMSLQNGQLRAENWTPSKRDFNLFNVSDLTPDFHPGDGLQSNRSQADHTLLLSSIASQISNLESSYMYPYIVQPKTCGSNQQLESQLLAILPQTGSEQAQALLLLEQMIPIMLKRCNDSHKDSLTFSPIVELEFQDQLVEEQARLDQLDKQVCRLLSSQGHLEESLVVSELSLSQGNEIIQGSVVAWTSALGLMKDSEASRITMHQHLRASHGKMQAHVSQLHTQLSHYQSELGSTKAELLVCAPMSPSTSQ